MADLTPFKSNYFHNYKNIGYVIKLSYLHPKYINDPASHTLQGNVFACSQNNLDPAQLAPEVKAYTDYELLISDLTFESMPVTDSKKGPNLVSVINFSVTEPNGMTFLEIIAAMHRNGTSRRPEGPSEMNWVTAPYLLTVEFYGYDTDDGAKKGSTVAFPQFTRRIPVVFTKVDFHVRGSSTRYDIRAIPLSEVSQLENTTIEETVTFRGTTVVEILNNFMAALNQKEKENYEAAYKDDENTSGAERFVTHLFLYQTWAGELLNSKMVIDETSSKGKKQLNLSTKLPMGNPAEFANTKQRPKVVINEEIEFTVAKDKTIDQVILQIVTNSNWFYEQFRAKELNGRLQREQPVIKIPKIFTFTDIAEPRDSKTNTFNRINYYAISLHDYLNTNTANFGNNTQEQIDQMKKHKESRVVREYNYLFTGKNIDILDLDLRFNLLFQNSLSIYNNRYGSGSQLNAQHKNTTFKENDSEKNVGRTIPSPESEQTATYGGLPANNLRTPPSPRTGIDLDRANFYAQVRNDLERIFDTQSLVDFQTLNMTIVGDPAYFSDRYYNKDSFFRLISDRNPGTAILEDGTIDWSEDVMIKLNVNRPLTGDLVASSTNKQYVTSSLLSRTYRVIRVKNVFSNGLFTQEIQAVFTPPIPDRAAVAVEKTIYDETSNTNGQTDPGDAQLYRPTPLEQSGPF